MEFENSKMKRKCCVSGCVDRQSKRHRFPKDNDLLSIWIENINMPGLEEMDAKHIYNSYYICDIHFAKEYLVQGTKRGLRKDAIPTLHLPAGDATNKSEKAEPVYTKQFIIGNSVDLKEEAEDGVDEYVWENQRFNSLQAYQEDNGFTTMCRICLRAINSGTTSHILTSEDKAVGKEIQQKVKSTLPHMNLGLFSISVICGICLKLINSSIELQKKWLLAEDLLKGIFEKRKTEKNETNDVIIMIDNSIKKPNTREMDAVNTSISNNLPTTTSFKRTLKHLLHTTHHIPKNGQILQSEPQTASANSTRLIKNLRKMQDFNITCTVCRQVPLTVTKNIDHNLQHLKLKNRCFRCKDKFINVRRFTRLKKLNDKNIKQEKYSKYVCKMCNKEFLFSWYLEQHLNFCTKRDSVRVDL